MNPRDQVITFFRELGPKPRHAVARETLSRLLLIAYPTLDPLLEELRAEGLLETHPCVAYLWRATASFIFADVVSEAQLRRRAKRDARARAIEERKAEQIRRQLERDEVARQRRMDKDQREARMLELAREAVRKRDEARARAGVDRLVRLESITAKREEAAARRIAGVKRYWDEKRKVEEALARAPAERSKALPSLPSDDPWERIKAKRYARPPLLPGGMTQDPALMTRGRC